MGKLTTYLIMISGITLLFHFFGLIESGTTVNSFLLKLLLDPSSFQDASFWLKAVTAMEGIGIAGAVILGFVARSPELAAMVGFSIFMINILFDVMVVFTKVYSIAPVMAILMFSPFLILLGVTGIEWWRGQDG